MKVFCLLLLVSLQGLGQSTEIPRSSSGEYEGVVGNPYFIKDWSDGVVRFLSGKTSDKFKLKFNSAQNRLLLQFNGSTFGGESNVKEFVMFTKGKKDSFLFRKGFPNSDRGNADTYYQVLADGHATLLKLITKDIAQEKEVLASKVSRQYIDVELLYLLHGGTIHAIDKDKIPAVQDLLTDRREELKNYISDQQLKLRSADDLVKLVKKYNELHQ